MNAHPLLNVAGHLLICAFMVWMIVKTSPWPRALPVELNVFLLAAALYYRGWESVVLLTVWVIGALVFAYLRKGSPKIR